MAGTPLAAWALMFSGAIICHLALHPDCIKSIELDIQFVRFQREVQSNDLGIKMIYRIYSEYKTKKTEW